MQPNFPSLFFENNRERLRQLFPGKAPIVIAANGLMQRGGDNSYKFTQDANFWYLTGINEPNIILVMDGAEEYLIVPEMDTAMKFFNETKDYLALSKIAGIKNIYGGREGHNKLKSRTKKVRHIATIAAPQPFIERYGLYTNPSRSALAIRLKSYNDQVELLDLSPHLSRLRSVKSPEELGAIQAAVDLTIRALKQVTNQTKLKNYTHEYQIEAELTKTLISANSDHAFDPIVASGLNACTLHYESNKAKLNKKDLLLIDCGGLYSNYCADITHTISLSSPTKRQRSVYEAVLAVQLYAINLLKPGVNLVEYEHQVMLFMGEKLRELNLIKSINPDNVRKYYPSSTSHFLGLNVHDVGQYKEPLMAGMVLTVEPGIYIKEEGIGVRIEDDLLITDTGNKNLSISLPRQL